MRFLQHTHKGWATVWGGKVIQGRRINKSQEEPLPKKYQGVDVLCVTKEDALFKHIDFQILLLLNYLCLVDRGGVGTDPAGFRVNFGPQCAISLRIMSHAAGLGHVGAVGLTVLVIGVLLTCRTTQSLVDFVLVVHRRWVAAVKRRVLAGLGRAPLLQISIPRDDGAAIQVFEHLRGVEDGHRRGHQGRVEARLLLQGQGRHHQQEITQRLMGWLRCIPEVEVRLQLAPEQKKNRLTKDMVQSLTNVSTRSWFSSSMSVCLCLVLRELL